MQGEPELVLTQEQGQASVRGSHAASTSTSLGYPSTRLTDNGRQVNARLTVNQVPFKERHWCSAVNLKPKEAECTGESHKLPLGASGRYNKTDPTVDSDQTR